MCFKKIAEWFKPDPAPIIPDFTKNTIVSIVKGDYPGSANDLEGPPYDQEDLQKAILAKWSHYVFRNFKDNASTANRLLSELTGLVQRIESDDLFLSINDNCFSESNTKDLLNPSKIRILQNRVYYPPGLTPRKKVRSKAFKLAQANKYIAMSACLDHESASDAYFEHPNGAYTYCLIKTLEKGITYLQWHEKTKALLKQLGFDQTCTIEGPLELQNKIIFEGNVSAMYVSSHGSFTYDASGDEPDKQDEGPYLDRLILDDEINAIIATNPYLC